MAIMVIVTAFPLRCSVSISSDLTQARRRIEECRKFRHDERSEFRDVWMVNRILAFHSLAHESLSDSIEVKRMIEYALINVRWDSQL